MYWIITREPEDEIAGIIISGVLMDSNLGLLANVLNIGKSIVNDHPFIFIKPLFEECRIGLITDKICVRTVGADQLVISESLKLFLEKEIQGAEYIPVKFLGIEFEEPYYIVNVLKSIDCTDDEKSDYIPVDRDTDPTIYEIDSLALDESKIPEGLDLFLLGRTKHTIVVISQRLKELIENNQFSGFFIIPPVDLTV